MDQVKDRVSFKSYLYLTVRLGLFDNWTGISVLTKDVVPSRYSFKY